MMEGYTTTKEQHLRRNDGQTAGHSSPAPLFDPKMFKANREVFSIICDIKLIIVTLPFDWEDRRVRNDAAQETLIAALIDIVW